MGLGVLNSLVLLVLLALLALLALLVLVSVLPVHAILISKPRSPFAFPTLLGELGCSAGSVLPVFLTIPVFALV